MKIPKYEEIRKPAPHSYRPAEAMRPHIEKVLAAITRGIGAPSIIECFDTMTQERVAALAIEVDGHIIPFAILHNGKIAERLVPCCGLEAVDGDEVSENGLTPEEWDLLPCFEAMEGN